MEDDFPFYSVAYGLKEHEFSELPESTKKQMLRLMAQISESSFRRGLQHGKEMRHPTVVEVCDLRFMVPLDRSPSAHGFHEVTAVNRLFTEYKVLEQIGFTRPPDFVSGGV